MTAIEDTVLLAQKDPQVLECFLEDYRPFIQKQVVNLGTLGLEYDDGLSLAMITFVNCVQQYQENKGSFLHFSTVCIKNRLIDESRKQQKQLQHQLILPKGATGDLMAGAAEDAASWLAYDQAQERANIVEEIDRLSHELRNFGIQFARLPLICPKQTRARRQCLALAQAVVADSEMRQQLMRKRRLAQATLAHQFQISPKTIEKHRAYIVTVAVLLVGDYPNIKAFLPRYGGGEVVENRGYHGHH